MPVLATQNPLSNPNPIVTVEVSTVQAPLPNNYQQMGALVSHGGTNLADQSIQLLAQYSDLTPYVLPAASIATLSWLSSEVTVTTLNPHGFTIGVTMDIYITGNTPVGYNGLFACTITGTNSFTYALVSNPGALTVPGIYQSQAAIELTAMARTWFGQRPGTSVYILELGESDAPTSIAGLVTWLTNNPFSFYGYLCPRYWDGQATFLALIATYENPEAMTYFWVTTTVSTYTAYSKTMKCVILMVEAPLVVSTGTEFTTAAAMFWGIQFKATAVTRVSPMCFKYLYGVTLYPTVNNAPLLQQLKAAAVNYVAYGSEGGISKTMMYPGVTADGNDYFNWWWTIDWIQINVNLDLSNEIINGSNNPLAPLYDDQNGINRLLGRLAATMTSAQQFGMVNGNVVQTEYNPTDLTAAISNGKFAGLCDCNAVPFLDYSILNPSDYAIGEYDGLSTLFIPARGFVHVLVQIIASQLVTV
jgi:hypothetical protein